MTSSKKKSDTDILFDEIKKNLKYIYDLSITSPREIYKYLNTELKTETILLRYVDIKIFTRNYDTFINKLKEHFISLKDDNDEEKIIKEKLLKFINNFNNYINILIDTKQDTIKEELIELLTFIQEKNPLILLDLHIFLLNELNKNKYFDLHYSIKNKRIGDIPKIRYYDEYDYLDTAELGYVDIIPQQIIDGFIYGENLSILNILYKDEITSQDEKRKINVLQKILLNVSLEFKLKVKEFLSTSMSKDEFIRIFKINIEEFLDKNPNKINLILYYLSTKPDILTKLKDIMFAIKPFSDDEEVQDTSTNNYYYLIITSCFLIPETKENFKNKFDGFTELKFKEKNIFRDFITKYFLNIFKYRTIIALTPDNEKFLLMAIELILSIIKKDGDYTELIDMLRKYKYYKNCFEYHLSIYILNTIHHKQNRNYYKDLLYSKLLNARTSYKPLYNFTPLFKERDLLIDTYKEAQSSQRSHIDVYIEKLKKTEILKKEITEYFYYLFENNKEEFLKLLQGIMRKDIYIGTNNFI